jgi:hypothetical protein
MKKKTLKISPNKIRNAGISVCVVFTLAFSGLAVFNYYRYSESVKGFTKKNSHLMTLEKDAKDLQKFIQEYKEEKARLEKILFSDKDIATFLDQISGFANNAKVTIKDMKAQKFQKVKSVAELEGNIKPARTQADGKKEETGPTLSALPIKMTVEAEFEPLIGFLISLEKYRQLLTLSDVRIERKGSYPALDCKFTLRLYSLKELAELGK